MNGDNKPISGGINTLIENLTRPIGKPIGQLLGPLAEGMVGAFAPQYQEQARQAGVQAGEGLPRFAGEVAAYSARHPALKALGLGDVLLRSYSQPGADIGTALGETSAFAAAPAVGSFAGKMAQPLARAAGETFASPGAQYLAKQAVTRGASLAGSIAPFEAASALEHYRQGVPYNPLSPENVIETAANVLPFEAMHLPGLVKGYRDAASPLVNRTLVSDQPDLWRVHWNAHDQDNQLEFADKQSSFDFSDQIRKSLMVEPQVEAAGSMPRQWVKHSMAWSPDELRGGPFGLRASEVLNTMPQTEMPGSQMLGTLKNKMPKSEFEALPGFEDFLKGQKTVH